MSNIPILEKKRILLGVTGSIACYKAADLASALRQAGAQVTVILTEAATAFVSPLTFQSVTGQRAYLDVDLWGREGHVLHVGLAEGADLLVIAPVTANTMARLAHGEAGNMLTLTALAARCPILLAPAMDGGMYDHPATQANLALLKDRGLQIIGPAEGHLASGLRAIGRLVEPDQLLGHIRLALAADGPLRGRQVVVTAGGTREPIDPVRSITNRSSGKQGFALAQAALDLGAGVTLITGPAALSTPVGARRVEVETAAGMLEAVMAAIPGADALLMAAAVADFTPEKSAAQKLKKRDGLPEIRLEATPDILLAVADYKARHGTPRVTVGFAAESENLEENAQEKLRSKKLDLMVANDISAPDAGFAVDTNRVTVLIPGRPSSPWPRLTKDEVARQVLDLVASRLAAGHD